MVSHSSHWEAASLQLPRPADPLHVLSHTLACLLWHFIDFVSVWDFFCSRKKWGLLLWKRINVPWYPQPHHVWCLLPPVEFRGLERQDLHGMEDQRPDTGPGQTQLLPVCSAGFGGLRVQGSRGLKGTIGVWGGRRVNAQSYSKDPESRKKPWRLHSPTCSFAIITPIMKSKVHSFPSQIPS